MDILNGLRNSRGDISHGKVTPKKQKNKSSPEFARLILNISDDILFYILTIYFSINISMTYGLRYEDKDLLDFNEYLDEEYTTNVKDVLYSKLLYENDYDSYEAEFDKWIEYQSENYSIDERGSWR